MSQSYVLDTSVFLALIRGGDLGLAIDRAYGLRTAFHRHIVSIVTHGELRVLAARNQWGNQKSDTLMSALQQVVTVNVDNGAIIDAYVRVEGACRKAPGGERKIGQNDMWIGATALHTGLPLLTTDKDFAHLHNSLILVHWIDPSSGPLTVQ